MSRRLSSTRRILSCSIALAAFAAGTPLEAAILSLDGVQHVTTTVSTPVNLTISGGVDWAYWATTNTTGFAPPLAATNEKTGGTAISSLDTIGGGNLRGSSTASTVERYSWTDGTTTASGSNASLAGLVFNSQLGSSAAGKGWKLTIAGDTAQEQIVTLYVGGFGATGNLLVTLNGVVTPITSSSVYDLASPKAMDVFTLRFRPDSAADLLQVQYTASAITETTNGHVGLQAVTVAVVPEPATAALLGLGSLAFFRRRRA